MPLGPGSKLGPFKIQSLIGKGGMGEVFSATDTRLGRQVALKILPADFAAAKNSAKRNDQRGTNTAFVDLSVPHADCSAHPNWFPLICKTQLILTSADASRKAA